MYRNSRIGIFCQMCSAAFLENLNINETDSLAQSLYTQWKKVIVSCLGQITSRSYYSKYYQESHTFTESDQLLAKKNRRVSYGVSTSISVSDEDPSLDESSTSEAKPPLTCRQWQVSISFLKDLVYPSLELFLKTVIWMHCYFFFQSHHQDCQK